MNEVLFAFLLTLLAGLFTGLGGLIALFGKGTNTRFLALCLSFSAGVMIYISFIEIFPKALESLSDVYGESIGFTLATVAFFAGVLATALLDKFIPHENETVVSLTPISDCASLTPTEVAALRRMGLMTAIAIAIHNFPEGLVTFMAALQDPALGVTIAIAIAIHNIPEGIAIAVPIRYATGSRKKALLASIGAGLTEPLGAIAAYFLLARFMTEGSFGILFAAVGGIMVYISVNQLLPAAQRYCSHTLVMRGLFAGMAVMAASLLLL